jgi:hypothetical protein
MRDENDRHEPGDLCFRWQYHASQTLRALAFRRVKTVSLIGLRGGIIATPTIR